MAHCNKWEQFTNRGVPHGCIYGHAVIIPHCDSGVQSKPHYAPIIIQCVHALVDNGKYNEFSTIQNKLITFF